MLGRVLTTIFARSNGCEPLLVVMNQIGIQVRGIRVPCSCVLQVVQCRVENDSASLHFLAVRASGSGQLKSTDQRWKRDSLQHEGCEDNAEREEHNHVPLWERAAGRQ